jgi:hypothetical protein
MNYIDFDRDPQQYGWYYTDPSSNNVYHFTPDELQFDTCGRVTNALQLPEDNAHKVPEVPPKPFTQTDIDNYPKGNQYNKIYFTLDGTPYRIAKIGNQVSMVSFNSKLINDTLADANKTEQIQNTFFAAEGSDRSDYSQRPLLEELIKCTGVIGNLHNYLPKKIYWLFDYLQEQGFITVTPIGSSPSNRPSNVQSVIDDDESPPIRQESSATSRNTFPTWYNISHQPDMQLGTLFTLYSDSDSGVSSMEDFELVADFGSDSDFSGSDFGSGSSDSDFSESESSWRSSESDESQY